MVCKDCSERYIGCHANCERYKAEKEKIDQISQKKRQHEELSYALEAVKMASVKKGKRK